MKYTDEIKFPGSEKYPNWLVWAALAYALPWFLVFAVLGQPMRGWIAALSAGAITFVIVILWDLRRFLSFWIVMVLDIGVHCFIVYKSNWPDTRFPGIVATPLVVCDVLFWLYVAVITVRRLRI